MKKTKERKKTPLKMKNNETQPDAVQKGYATFVGIVAEYTPTSCFLLPLLWLQALPQLLLLLVGLVAAAAAAAAHTSPRND